MRIEQVPPTVPVDQVLRILEAQLEILKVLAHPPMVITEDEEDRP